MKRKHHIKEIRYANSLLKALCVPGGYEYEIDIGGD